MGAAERNSIDFDELADVLKAMAYPARLELLGILRVTQTLREIRLTPRRIEEGESRERPAARQTVQRHLDKLIENGLVRTEPAPPGSRDQIAYTASPAMFYAVIEALRSLLVRYAGLGLGPEHTQTARDETPILDVPGSRLMLVHGVYEGKAYPLSDKTAKDGCWTIGRSVDLPIGLDYDPFVSRESAVVKRVADGFTITDLGSKNGTTVNWRPLASGETQPLATGDIIGVGRSRLVFTR